MSCAQSIHSPPESAAACDGAVESTMTALAAATAPEATLLTKSALPIAAAADAVPVPVATARAPLCGRSAFSVDIDGRLSLEREPARVAVHVFNT